VALRAGADWMTNLDPQSEQKFGVRKKSKFFNRNLPRDEVQVLGSNCQILGEQPSSMLNLHLVRKYF
jgi:hypothetical protein